MPAAHHHPAHPAPPAPAPLPTPPPTQRGASPTLSCTTAGTAHRVRPAPLLTLAPSALPPAIDDDAQPEDEDISVIWNVISRAADVVKDGERLENLAWRHWGQRPLARRRASSSSTASSASILTPVHEQAPSFARERSCERRSFTGKLKLVVEETSFKDWIEDARQHPPARSTPILSVPDTPTPNLEIRLVEPTPAPSRVGSLGGSVGSLPVNRAVSQPPVREEIAEHVDEPPVEPNEPPARRRNRFFIHDSSPGKSGSESSQASAPVPAATQPAEPEAVGSPNGSNWRSSAESSSAVVMKKKERRHVSMANMRGRFQGEKRQAAQAIAARNKEQQQDDDDEWEDAEDADDDEETAASAEDTKSGDEDDENWEDEESSSEDKRRAPPPPPPPPPPQSKKERAQAKARFDIEQREQREQRKRAMFTKLQVDTSKVPQGEGLLTRTFRSGKSMIDLTQAGRADHDLLRRNPTHSQLSSLMQSPPMASPTPALLRSKSAVAMPVQSGVSVTSRSHRSGTSDDKRSHKSGTSDDKRPTPVEVEMESSDEDSDEDNYLASSKVREKLDALVAKREERHQQRAGAIPLPAQNPSATDLGDLDEHGIVRPISPASRRRMIIVREMSESLRRNIILEREKSSGRTSGLGHARPPPSVHTSRLPSASSGLNLAAMNANPHPPDLQRHSSHPNLTQYQETAPLPTTSPEVHRRSSASPTEPQRRRPNLLGAGFLRPLTRADGPGIGRAHSTAALNLAAHNAPPVYAVTSPGSDASISPYNSSGTGGTRGSAGFHAPPMVRSSTEGDQKERERARLKRELARRGEHSDTSYRFHGW